MSDYFTIYENKNYRGKSYTVRLSRRTNGRLYTLKGTNVHDKMSSIRWSLSAGKKVTLYEDNDGTGRRYTIAGKGGDPDTHNNNFKDCASSYRLLSSFSIPAAFRKIRTRPTVYKFKTGRFRMPDGGHIQGVQKLSSRHLVVSGSSKKVAYFFILEWPSRITIRLPGTIVSFVNINQDFPGLRDAHAGGIQLAGKTLAVGTESGKKKSNVVFYNLANVRAPKPFKIRIPRTHDSAGAIALLKFPRKFLLAVGGWDAKAVDFYQSNTTNLATPNCRFTKIKTWRKDKRNTTGWVDANWGNYQGLNLIRDKSKCYLVGFNRNLGGHDWADLFELHLKLPNARMLVKVDKKHVKCQKGASFRWAGGLYAPQPTRKITLLAVERDFHDQTTINCF